MIERVALRITDRMTGRTFVGKQMYGRKHAERLAEKRTTENYIYKVVKV